jgi:hypothetical protein
MRQKQAFAPRAAMHKYTAWRLPGRSGRVDQRHDELLITRADPPLGTDLVLISITMLAIHIWALCGAGDQQTARLRQEESPRNRLESRLTPR